MIKVIRWIMLTAMVTGVTRGQDMFDILPDSGARRFHDMIQASPQYKPLMDALKNTQGNSFTLFAPSDEALDAIADKPDQNYAAQFRYHLASGRIQQSDMQKGPAFHNTTYKRSAKEKNLLIATGPDGVWSFGNKSRIIKGDIQASNGIVHIVDRLLMLPVPAQQVLKQLPWTGMYAAQLEALNMSLSLVTHATVFAPTDEAMKQLESIKDQAMLAQKLQRLVIDKSFIEKPLKEHTEIKDHHGVGFNITHHVNGDVTAGSTRILYSDQLYDDGVIHITEDLVTHAGLEKPQVDIPLPRQTSGQSSITLPLQFLGLIILELIAFF